MVDIENRKATHKDAQRVAERSLRAETITAYNVMDQYHEKAIKLGASHL
jgi:hypothetical protein